MLVMISEKSMICKKAIKRAKALEASKKNEIQSPRSEKQCLSSHKQQTVQSYKATAIHCPSCSDPHSLSVQSIQEYVTDRKT